MPDPDPFDPIAEAHRQWSSRWPAHADHMAAVTSVMRVQQLLLARIEAILQPHGLTFAAYEALRLLAFTRSGSMPMGKMGERLMVHPASVTNAIRRLEQRGLVERHTSAGDRRVVLATITEGGRAVARDATAALNQADFGIAALSPGETAELTAMLRHVRVAVGDVADPADRRSAAPARSSLFHGAERSVVPAGRRLNPERPARTSSRYPVTHCRTAVAAEVAQVRVTGSGRLAARTSPPASGAGPGGGAHGPSGTGPAGRSTAAGAR